MTEHALQPRKILWIEDDYYHIKGLVRPLEREGFVIVPARSVVEAKQALDMWKTFCLIVLDLIIPHTDAAPVESTDDSSTDPAQIAENGVKLLAYMRDDLHVDLPILVLSIVNNDKIIERVMAHNVLRPFVKFALRPQQVFDAVIDALGMAKELIGNGNGA